MLKTLMFFLLICFLYKDNVHDDHDHDHVDTQIQIKVEDKKRMTRL